jgi:anti-sigma factor RsiW
MSCAEVARFIHVYLDGEFAAEERAEMEGHLAGCPACAEAARRERQFLDRVRGTLRADGAAAPAALAARIDRALDQVERPAPRTWRTAITWGLPAAVAAALLLAAMRAGEGQLPSQPDERAMAMPVLFREAVARHERELPVEVRGPDPEQVRTWFRGKLDVPVRPPALLAPSVQLLGARLSHLGDRQAAYLVYDVGGSKFSVFIFDPQNLETERFRRRTVRGHDVYLGGEHGYHVAVLRDGGLGYAFASDLPEARMLDLLSAAFAAP